VIRTHDLGRSFQGRWALRHCTVTLPTGSVTALVGLNGAGKTTLLRLLAGLSRPTEGALDTAGQVAFVGQDKPLYRGFTVADTLRLGASLNAGWDQARAERRLQSAGVPLGKRVGRLSGGQRTQVAVALALGKRAPVLLLDEPMADLDPVARDELMRELLGECAEEGTTLVLSSHVVAELADTCDHLVLLNDGRLQLAGEIATLLDGHRLLVGPADASPADQKLGPHAVVRSSTVGRQANVLVRTSGPVHDPRWQVHEVGLAELVVAYLRDARTPVGVPA
jgi:ABC-2 type transport system ATP-binding protein